MRRNRCTAARYGTGSKTIVLEGLMFPTSVAIGPDGAVRRYGGRAVG